MTVGQREIVFLSGVYRNGVWSKRVWKEGWRSGENIGLVLLYNLYAYSNELELDSIELSSTEQ